MSAELLKYTKKLLNYLMTKLLNHGKAINSKYPQFRNLVIPLFSNSAPAFTLIEALTVFMLIGILAALSVTVFGNVSKRGRDARRKSDLTAISLSFQARYDSKVCANPADLGHYPGRSFSPTKWKTVSSLSSLNNDCGAFSEYLTVIPANPADVKNTFPYRFDLSTKSPDGANVVGKSYRLAARLESVISLQQQADLDRLMTVWVSSFGGSALPSAPLPGQNYNYVIGQ